MLPLLLFVFSCSTDETEQEQIVNEPPYGKFKLIYSYKGSEQYRDIYTNNDGSAFPHTSCANGIDGLRLRCDNIDTLYVDFTVSGVLDFAFEQDYSTITCNSFIVNHIELKNTTVIRDGVRVKNNDKMINVQFLKNPQQSDTTFSELIKYKTTNVENLNDYITNGCRENGFVYPAPMYEVNFNTLFEKISEPREIMNKEIEVNEKQFKDPRDVWKEGDKWWIILERIKY
tara:strand:+ start:754 stop:1440 length:687 start_codon:yes stop_codon:yes gene_type:complete